nr:Tn3 family transposase [Sinorhizobium meliloti]
MPIGGVFAIAVENPVARILIFQCQTWLKQPHSRIYLPSGNWNDIRRLVTTIRSGQVRPSTLLAKLSAFPRQNGLALALRDLGRINRSIFLPAEPGDAQKRDPSRASLNAELA